MRRRALIAGGGIVVAVVLAVGVWQLAYAQGQVAGRAEVAAARAEFTQGRPVGSGGATGAPGGGAGGQGGQGGQGGRAGQGPVAGTIDKVDGTTLTVTTEAGAVAVTLGGQTRITRQATAAANDLKAGDRIVVTGPRAADGTLAAVAIQIQPSGQ